MSNITTRIKRDYVLGQGISYFLLAALGASAVTHTQAPSSNPSFFYFEKFENMPMPVPVLDFHIDLAYWTMLIFSILVLILSFIFFVVLFNRKWTSKAAELSESLSRPMSAIFVMGFSISLFGSLTPIFVKGNLLLAAVFTYSGFIAFILVWLHLIRGYFKINDD